MRRKLVSSVLLVLLSATIHGLELEGSGDEIPFGDSSYHSTLQDQELGGDQGDLLEGSGEEEKYDWTELNANGGLDTTDFPDYYGIDNYDYLDDYLDEETDTPETVLDDTEENDIEIQSRPTDSEEEEIVFNMSQIFIMVGSSFISFAIFMFTFFLCRRLIANKQKKSMHYMHATPEKMPPTKEPPIVKDYQKVPTSTQEILKSNSQRIEMYGNKDPENPSMAPLVP